VPWARFGILLNRTELLWQQSRRAITRVQCEGPPCADCATIADQHACVVDIELSQTPERVLNQTRETCWPGCRFTKARPPEVPALCWNDSEAFAWRR